MINIITILEKIDNFKNLKIAVIGDIMVDRFLIGDSNRISPEAPIPVVFINDEKIVPGGAANVASNISSLGGQVDLIGVIGDDQIGNLLLGILKGFQVNHNNIYIDKKGVTTEKTRVLARGQQIIRMDKETNRKLSKKIEQKILETLKNNLNNYDAIIISDYNKGFFTKNIAQEIIRLANENNKLVIGDIKPNNKRYFKNISYITPNTAEALEMGATSNRQRACQKLQKALNCNVLLTEGANGMTLHIDEHQHYIPAETQDVYDIVGAGDTVVASFTLSLASGLTPLDSAYVSNISASIAVAKFGTAIVTFEELKKKIANRSIEQ